MSVHDPCLGAARNAWRGDEVSRSPTPTLYQVSGGYSSQVARLALVEKGVAFKSRYVDLNNDTTQVRDRPEQTGCWQAPEVAHACGALRVCCHPVDARLAGMPRPRGGVSPLAALWRGVGLALGACEKAPAALLTPCTRPGS